MTVLTALQISCLDSIAATGARRAAIAAEVDRLSESVKLTAIDALIFRAPIMHVATASGYSRATIEQWAGAMPRRGRGERGEMDESQRLRVNELSVRAAKRAEALARLTAIDAQLRLQCRQARYFDTPLSTIATHAGIAATRARAWLEGAPLEAGRALLKRARADERAEHAASALAKKRAAETERIKRARWEPIEPGPIDPN